VKLLCGIFSHQELLDKYVTPQQRQRVVDLLLQLLPKTQLHADFVLMTALIDLAGTTLSYIPPSKFLSIITTLAPLPSTSPGVTEAIIEFLSKSSQVKLEASLQIELFNKFVILWQTLFSTTDWAIFQETLSAFKHFSKFTLFEDISLMFPAELKDVVIGYFGEQPFDYPQSRPVNVLLEQHGKDLLALTNKKRKAVQLPREFPDVQPPVPSDNAVGVEVVPLGLNQMNGDPATMASLKLVIKQVKDGLEKLSPLPEGMSRGSLEWLKQEIKSVKTMVLGIDDALHSLRKC